MLLATTAFSCSSCMTFASFTAMVDIDGDGLISYQEFMLFRTLIAIPKRKVNPHGGGRVEGHDRQ